MLFTALQEAMTELHLRTGLIVTRSEEDQLETPEGTIRVIPVWRFLLEETDLE
jgi:predicted AAA+ superfamily ATPase